MFTREPQGGVPDSGPVSGLHGRGPRAGPELRGTSASAAICLGRSPLWAWGLRFTGRAGAPAWPRCLVPLCVPEAVRAAAAGPLPRAPAGRRLLAGRGAAARWLQGKPAEAPLARGKVPGGHGAALGILGKLFPRRALWPPPDWLRPQLLERGLPSPEVLWVIFLGGGWPGPQALRC